MAACDSYDFGECTWGACEYAYWVPEGLGNAGDWAANAAARGYEVTMVPTIGSVAVYGSGDGYSIFGHCGVVIDVAGPDRFLIHEMNYTAWDQYDDRWSNTYDVVGFILQPGTSPGGGAPSVGLGGTGPAQDLSIAWSSLAADWNYTMPNELAQMRGDRLLMDTI